MIEAGLAMRVSSLFLYAEFRSRGTYWRRALSQGRAWANPRLVRRHRAAAGERTPGKPDQRDQDDRKHAEQPEDVHRRDRRGLIDHLLGQEADGLCCAPPPAWRRVATACCHSGMRCACRSARCDWCRVARRSQKAVVREAAKPPKVMRAKLERPLADGVCSGGTSFSWMVIIETKKVLIATPCTSIGITSTPKLTSGVR